MKKQLLTTVGLASFAATFILATPSFAVDPIAASADMAQLSTVSGEAKANLSEAALNGDVDAIAEAQKRSAAAEAAVADGQAAQTAMDQALADGDQDAADAAAADLVAAVEAAQNAVDGAIAGVEASSSSQPRTAAPNRGGPGRPFDAPNMYENLSGTATQVGILQEVFGGFWASSSFGTRGGLGDLEATPE